MAASGPDGVLERPSISHALFNEVVFHIVESQTLPCGEAREIASILIYNGAREAPPLDPVNSSVRIDLEEVSHIISANIDFPGYVEAEKFMIPVVTPEWAKVSLQKKRLAHVRPYNPDPRFFFSGVMVTVAELPTGDKEAICGGVIAMGGQYSSNLTKFTTHIVALNMDNDKCRQATAKKLAVKIVLPHWFDDCLKLNRRIDEAPYLLPNPEVENIDSSEPVPLPKGPDLSYSHAHNGGPMAYDPPSPRPNFAVFVHKRVKLGEDLGLSSRLRAVISTIIRQAKGMVVEKIEDANTYVGQFREGEDYAHAHQNGMSVGNLTWLYWMFAHGEWASPLRRLLHYPVVRGGLPGMHKNVITVSNYGGDARLYLENLIEACGAKFTKSMKADNTHLITARSYSEKCTAAREWNIHMINHLWLEESYAKWQVQSLSNPKYGLFPPRTNLMEVVGQTSIDPSALKLSHGKHEDTMSIDENLGTDPEADWPVVGHIVSVNGKATSPLCLTNDQSSTPQAKNSKSGTRPPTTKFSTPSRWNRAGLSETPLSATSSGRKAKEQAAARLHNSVMPDVMMYEKEQRRKGGVIGGGRRRKSESPAEERAALLSKRSASEGAMSASEDEMKLGPKKGKKRPKPTVHLLITAYRDWVDNPQKEEADKKGLSNIGVQCVADPAACTHLAAPHIVRTEKFCCALAKAPIIVSTQWPQACLREERIVDPDPFVLRDSEGEERLKMNLRESLERARQNGGRLLQGQTIYCAPGVHGGFETYKRIVEANGGICIAFRMAKKAANVPDSDKLVLLSGDDMGDKKLWSPFLKIAKNTGKDAVIYKSDWLLDLAMTQKVVWSDKYEFPV